MLEDDGLDRGLMFAIIGADIRRQFEFVQANWLNDSEFINSGTQVDPVAGAKATGGVRDTTADRSGVGLRACRSSSSTGLASTASCRAFRRSAGLRGCRTRPAGDSRAHTRAFTGSLALTVHGAIDGRVDLRTFVR